MSRHDHRGLPKKGEPSRNPSGRPKATEGWRASLRADESLRRKLRKMISGQWVPTEAQSKALLYALDQGFGRASQEQKVEIDNAASVRRVLAAVAGIPGATEAIIAALKQDYAE